MAYDIGPLEEGARGARRLLALAGYLVTVDEARYDHRTWRRVQEEGDWAMCALGHGLTALPDLIGLRWRNAESQDVVRLDGSGLTEDAIALAAEAFELTYHEAETMFGVGTQGFAFYGRRKATDITPKIAADAIADFALRSLAAARA